MSQALQVPIDNSLASLKKRGRFRLTKRREFFQIEGSDNCSEPQSGEDKTVADGSGGYCPDHGNWSDLVRRSERAISGSRSTRVKAESYSHGDAFSHFNTSTNSNAYFCAHD
jgi:hypothetical protein